MDLTPKEILDYGFFVAVILITLYNAFKSGKPADPLSLALKIVTAAEETIVPKEGENWAKANERKLRYALDQMKSAHPELDVALIQNLIERAVDLLKDRIRLPAARSMGSMAAEIPVNRDKFSQF